MKANKEKFLGVGTEKTVYEDLNDPNRAVGVFHEYRKESANLVKGRFYLNKILHILFPENIPDIHMAGTDPHMIVADKVAIDKERRISPKDLQNSEIKDLVIELGLLGVKTDTGENNFKYDMDGNLVYVDAMPPWIGNIRHPNYDENKLRERLQNLENGRKEQALTYFSRLEALAESEAKNFGKGKN